MDNNYNNFLDDAVADEVYEEVYEEVVTPDDNGSAVLVEAVKRIEQAKLYEALLNHNLFGEGSGRPELVAIVQKEIRDFVISRLENLLGIAPSNPKPEVNTFSHFSEEEVGVLKLLAGRAIEKTKSRLSPEPVVSPVASPPSQVPVSQTSVSHPTVKQAQVRQAAKPPISADKPVRKVIRKQRSQNIGEKTGQDRSQPIGDPQLAARRLPMPSAEQMNQLAAAQAASNLEDVKNKIGG
jgi:hypothetical protein